MGSVFTLGMQCQSNLGEVTYLSKKEEKEKKTPRKGKGLRVQEHINEKFKKEVLCTASKYL